MKLHS